MRRIRHANSDVLAVKTEPTNASSQLAALLLLAPAKATRRFSYGLAFTASYAFSKNLDNWEGSGNIFDRGSFKSLASTSLPHVLTTSINYTLPAHGFVARHRWARAAFADWNVNAMMQYTSGQLLGAPGSTNSIGTYLSGQGTRQFRVPGQPLYLKDPNCHCIDPTQETILNPAAWVDQAPGVWGTAAVYYNDFRGQRRPAESMSLGKTFAIRERAKVSVRAEFFNIFNRLESFPNPSTSNPATPPTRSNGRTHRRLRLHQLYPGTSISQNNAYPSPRTGQVVLRFDF